MNRFVREFSGGLYINPGMSYTHHHEGFLVSDCIGPKEIYPKLARSPGELSSMQHEMSCLCPKEEAMLVSVIIPVFNRRSFLKKALASVLEQTYNGHEIIIVDDGSTDGTPDLLSAYGDRIRTLYQPNSGVSAARNAGIREAQGALIAFLDSDDYWLPQKLEKQVAFFETHPQTLICQTEELWIRNGRRVNPKQRHKKPTGFIFEPSLSLCLVSPSAVMLRRSLLDEVGFFDESLPACEDYDLWLRTTWKYPVFLIDTPLVVKQGGHDDQLSRMAELDKYRIRAISNILKTGYLSRQQRSAALDVLEQKCRIYANGCRKRGRHQEADEYLNLPEQLKAGLAELDSYPARKQGCGNGSRRCL
jgi:glycosyltransferase involved in cell wall biosynthesis